MLRRSNDFYFSKRQALAQSFATVSAGRTVLNNLSDDVRMCHEHAEACARIAAQQTDSQLKQDYLDLQQKWLSLARSFQTAERTAEFINQAQYPSSTDRDDG